MDKFDLVKELDDALSEFESETKRLDDYSRRPVTEGDLKDFANQVFYVLYSYKNAITKYLD